MNYVTNVWIQAEARVQRWIEERKAFLPEVESIARLFAARKFRVGNAFRSVSLEELDCLATKLGYPVAVEDFPESHALERALTIFDANSDKQAILVNAAFFSPAGSASASRARFDIAHEIGHIVLSHPEGALGPDMTVEELESYLRLEWEANYFAGALLMDQHLARETMRRTRYNPQELAKAFSVTFHTAAHRLLVLAQFDGMSFRLLQVAQVDTGEPGAVRVIKSYASDPSIFPAPAIGALACRRWAVSQALAKGKSVRRFSILRDRSAYEKVLVVAEADGRLLRSAVSLSSRVDQLDRLDGAFGPDLKEDIVGRECKRSCPLFEQCSVEFSDLDQLLRDEDGRRGY